MVRRQAPLLAPLQMRDVRRPSVAPGMRRAPRRNDRAVQAAQPSTRSREQSAVWENALTELTDREHQVMCLVSEGLSNKEIGRRLNISDCTIKVHLHHIYEKLEISNRTALAVLAISQKSSSADNRADISGLPT